MDATTLTPFGTISCAELMAMEFPPIAPEPTAAPTWAELVEVEPELAEVERMALSLYQPGDNQTWTDWGRIKRAFLPLVGFNAKQYELRNSTCYDVCYDHLLHCWEKGRRP